jgi:transposase
MKHKSKEVNPQVKPFPKTESSLPILHPNVAGIDIGSESHFVAVPLGRDEKHVREFLSFTADLNKMVEWLKKCKIEIVAMESTGVFWIPVFEILDQNGFEVKLVNARHVKNVSAHKTDVEDCQWLQQLATFGLLKGAFRPKNDIVELRAYLRHRDNLIKAAAVHIQHMQKALTQMNLQIHNVISDITGKTGMAIIRSIVAGNRDPKALASLRDERCHNSAETIMKSLEGNYRKEHLFTLRQALDLYDVYVKKVAECDIEIQHKVKALETKPLPEKITTKDAKQTTSVLECSTLKKVKERKQKLKKHEFPMEMGNELIRITGVDLKKLPGIGVSSILYIISEIGVDLSPWRTSKHFASWLGLSPGNKVSGGKRLSGKTKPCANRVAIILRMAANSLYNADCALGAYLRRMKMRLGSPKAITACAHKLAKLLYCMLRYGWEYVEKGVKYYEDMYKARKEASLKRKAEEMGYKLVREEQPVLA